MTKKEDGEPWPERLVRAGGGAMKRARGAKSARLLSDETAALGYRVSPTVIAKLDSGHRGSVLNVTELLVLAAALDIPPGLLLFPGYPEGEVEYLPERIATSKMAVDWFSGEGTIPAQPDGEAVRPNTGTALVAAVRRFANMSRDLVDLAKWADAGELTKEATDLNRNQLVQGLNSLAAQIVDLRRKLEEDLR